MDTGINKKILLIKYNTENIKNSVSGTQIYNGYFDRNPPHRISMITFGSSFDPSKGRGYYLDFHFNSLKRRFREKKELIKKKDENIRMSLILVKIDTRINKDILKHISLFF